jgi:formylglycine-generating enzyme required for sulfatase activity
MKLKKQLLGLIALICLVFIITGCDAAGATKGTDSSNQAGTQTVANSNGATEAATKSAPVAGGGEQQMASKTYTLNGVAFKMIQVKAGTFTMGSDNKKVEFSESPAHKVTLTKDYYIGETEVTEALWNTVMGKGKGDNRIPRTDVTWDQAHVFIDKLNVLAHEQKLIAAGENFKLPTEAEWEYAAKGGNQSKGYQYSGSNDINEVAETLENTGSGSPVGVKLKKPNELGIYDMSGNAYEWVDDYAGPYTAADQVDPHNTTPSRLYVKRGGSNYHHFSSEPYLFTTTGRYFYGSTDWTIGFRIALQ